MKNILSLCTVFLFLLHNAYAQSGSNIAQAERKIEKLIGWIENKNIDTLLQHSTDSLYCSLCFNAPTDSYHISKQDFYAQHFTSVFTNDWLSRIRRNRRIVVSEKSAQHDLLLLYTTLDRDEVAPGHEGAQFGFWLKEENGDYKLSGVETIP